VSDWTVSDGDQTGMARSVGGSGGHSSGFEAGEAAAAGVHAGVAGSVAGSGPHKSLSDLAGGSVAAGHEGVAGSPANGGSVVAAGGSLLTAAGADIDDAVTISGGSVASTVSSGTKPSTGSGGSGMVSVHLGPSFAIGTAVFAFGSIFGSSLTGTDVSGTVFAHSGVGFCIGRAGAGPSPLPSGPSSSSPST